MSNLLENKDPNKRPCYFDHNGECLICDCWGSDCAYMRMINKDYKWESKEELEKMFKDEEEYQREKMNNNLKNK